MSLRGGQPPPDCLASWPPPPPVRSLPLFGARLRGHSKGSTTVRGRAADVLGSDVGSRPNGSHVANFSPITGDHPSTRVSLNGRPSRVVPVTFQRRSCPVGDAAQFSV